jgi:hypothetical protein
MLNRRKALLLGTTAVAASVSMGQLSSRLATQPVISAVRPQSASTSFFDVTNGNSIQSNNVNVRGTSVANATITVYQSGVSQGTTTADGGGNWAFPLSGLSDTTHVLTATATVDGNTSALSAPFNLTVTPPITQFTSTPSQSMYINGVEAIVYSQGNPYSITSSDPHTIRFEVRTGDKWVTGGDATSNVNRCEVGLSRAGTMQPNNVPFYLTFEILWESGPVNDTNWYLNYQHHNDDTSAGIPGSSPILAIGIGGTTYAETPGDHFHVVYRWWNDSVGAPLHQGTLQTVDAYIAPTNVTRGVWHRVQLEALPNNAGGGHLYAWFDGMQVVQLDNIDLGYGFPVYSEWGIYRAPSTVKNAVQMRNWILKGQYNAGLNN